ncbi:MAG: hypothetical protein ACPGVU_23005 [Limisphaerales bacterium]
MKMTSPDPKLLCRVLGGAAVFDRDTDSKILQAANGMSARAMFELFKRCDTKQKGWELGFAAALMEMTTGDPSILIGFDDGRTQGLEADEADLPEDMSETSADYYLKIEFTDADACYYQFHLFPAFDEPFIEGAARKREDRFQHVLVTLAHPDDLQVFIQNLRRNPHLRRVHDSSLEEFNDAPSQAV